MVRSEQFVFENPNKHDLTYTLVREGDWGNVYCQDTEDDKIVYYCRTVSDWEFEIHRGDKTGTVICKCKSTPHITEVELEKQHCMVTMHHLHHKNYPSKTTFTYNGKVYYWYEFNELVEEESGSVLAQYYPSWNVPDAHEHVLGKLVIKEYGVHLIDLIVITALILQSWSQEGKEAVHDRAQPPHKVGLPPIIKSHAV